MSSASHVEKRKNIKYHPSYVFRVNHFKIYTLHFLLSLTWKKVGNRLTWVTHFVKARWHLSFLILNLPQDHLLRLFDQLLAGSVWLARGDTDHTLCLLLRLEETKFKWSHKFGPEWHFVSLETATKSASVEH